MADLRAQVVGLIAAEGAKGRLLMWMQRNGAGDLAGHDFLDLIPQNAVLVTEEQLAEALYYADPLYQMTPREPGTAQRAAAILDRIRAAG